MKTIFKSRIIIFIVTAILFTGIGVYGATIYPYKASDVLYSASDGTSMNVNDAINELYESKIKGYDTKYEDISENVSISAGDTDFTVKLYKLNNTVRLVVRGNVATQISTSSFTLIGKITNNKYFPQSDIIDYGVGSDYGFSTIKIDCNGNIYAIQSLDSRRWVTFDMTWIASGI